MQWYYTFACTCTVQDSDMPNSSLAVVQLRFTLQNYTVNEGGVGNITLEAVTPSNGYEFDFTVNLLSINGSATGECVYTSVTGEKVGHL